MDVAVENFVFDAVMLYLVMQVCSIQFMNVGVLLPGNYLQPPIGGGTPPIDVNTHIQTVLPQWGVCTVLVVYSYTA